VPGNVETALLDCHDASRAAVHIFGNDGDALPIMIGDIFAGEHSADEGGWTISRSTKDGRLGLIVITSRAPAIGASK
jgi:hypothetical protein